MMDNLRLRVWLHLSGVIAALGPKYLVDRLWLLNVQKSEPDVQELDE